MNDNDLVPFIGKRVKVVFNTNRAYEVGQFRDWSDGKRVGQPDVAPTWIVTNDPKFLPDRISPFTADKVDSITEVAP